MNVLVVGANGNIGKHVVKILTKSDTHHVTAMVRKEEQAQAFRSTGVDTVIADLEGTVEQLAAAQAGCDAIIFTAGSGGKTGPDKTLLVDLDGAVKTIEAAEKTGVKRFIMISALQAHNRANWNEKIKPYYVAKHYADRVLQASSLNYTIIRPGQLLDDPGIAKISVKEDLQRAAIPREDVAKVAVAALTEVNTYHRSFDLTSGETDIATALKSL